MNLWAYDVPENTEVIANALADDTYPIAPAVHLVSTTNHIQLSGAKLVSSGADVRSQLSKLDSGWDASSGYELHTAVELSDSTFSSEDCIEMDLGGVDVTQRLFLVANGIKYSQIFDDGHHEAYMAYRAVGGGIRWQVCYVNYISTT